MKPKILDGTIIKSRHQKSTKEEHEVRIPTGSLTERVRKFRDEAAVCAQRSSLSGQYTTSHPATYTSNGMRTYIRIHTLPASPI